MRPIPTNRHTETMLFRRTFEEGPVVVFRPSPATIDPGDDVGGEAIVMCRLPWSRFRGFGLGQEVLLPLWAAISLVEFEVGLRESGLLGPEEVLKQLGQRSLKFGVQKRLGVVNRASDHELILFLKECFELLEDERGALVGQPPLPPGKMEESAPATSRGTGIGSDSVRSAEPTKVPGGCPHCGYRHPPDGMCVSQRADKYGNPWRDVALWPCTACNDPAKCLDGCARSAIDRAVGAVT